MLGRIARQRTASPPGFREMMFSDYVNYRRTQPSWVGVVMGLVSHPGLVASCFLRAQQCLFRAGRVRAAWALRSVCNAVTGADFVPGCEVGLGVFFAHPSGVTLGSGSRVGNRVTFANGIVVSADRTPSYLDATHGRRDAITTIGDDVALGAHAVILEGVTIGDRAFIGANSVVTTSVKANTIVRGIPATYVRDRPASDTELSRDEAASA